MCPLQLPAWSRSDEKCHLWVLGTEILEILPTKTTPIVLFKIPTCVPHHGRSGVKGLRRQRARMGCVCEMPSGCGI